MATINYAAKYSDLVDERFTQASITSPAFSEMFDWSGANTVNVYSLGTSAMRDYNMTGMQRYGNPDELSDTLQTMILTQDRAFTYTIDRRNYEDTMMVREVGRSLRRQLDEVVIPEVDIYRLKVLADKAGTKVEEVITEDNAYSAFIDAVVTIRGNNAPLIGTVAYISANFFKSIRLDKSFIKSGDISQSMLINGQVGTIEGIPVITVPFGYLPEGVEFLVTNRIAATSPQKIETFQVHQTPQGVNGWLVEGRIYHDAFVLNNKAKAIYVHKTP
jgi:hypothetical protein